MNQIDIDIDDLKTWIGNSEETVDEVSQSLEKRFKATLDLDPGNPVNGELASSGGMADIGVTKEGSATCC